MKFVRRDNLQNERYSRTGATSVNDYGTGYQSNIITSYTLGVNVILPPASTKILEKYTIQDNTLIMNVDASYDDSLRYEIGDITNQTDFIPLYKLLKWDDEVDFSMKLKHTESDPIVEYEDYKIKFIGTEIESHFYDLDDGYEFAVILKQKPKKNYIEFDIVQKGIEFLFQPALNEIYTDGWSSEFQKNIIVDECYVRSTNNDVIVYRPDNIINSYAIYCDEPKKNKQGGKKYRTGKVAHIHRPRIIDAESSGVWGTIDISGNKLTITIDQNFIDNATYPVFIDPTIGSTGIGGTTITFSTIYNARGSLYNSHTADAGDIITLFSYYGSRVSTSVTPLFEMAAYTIVAGDLNTRLSTAETMTINSSVNQWFNSAAVSKALVAGSAYNVAFGNFTVGSIYVRYDTSTLAAKRHNAVGSLPSTWVTDTTYDYKFSIYATYSTSVGTLIPMSVYLNQLRQQGIL